MPQFQKDNTSGKGPPKGSRNLSTLIREHLRHDAPERAATIVESALDKQRMEGVRALRQLSARPSGEIVEIDLPDSKIAVDILTSQNIVLQATARGEIETERAQELMRMLARDDHAGRRRAAPRKDGKICRGSRGDQEEAPGCDQVMTELEALRRLCEGQRQLARLLRSQYSAALQALADHLRQGRRFAATSLPRLADFYEDAQRRFFAKGEIRRAKVLLDIPAGYRARGLDPQEFLSDFTPNRSWTRTRLASGIQMTSQSRKEGDSR